MPSAAAHAVVHNAVPAPSAPRRARRERHWRSFLLAPLVLGMLLSTGFTLGRPVALARSSSCTGWSSLHVPPTSIRVLIHKGVVKTVPFKKYVAVVMGSEWGAYLPQATLDAAAIAVKQYGWYHTLRGNHRGGFVTHSGVCFDVVATVRDQIYRPHKANIGPKHWRAINRTWYLSLRKGGKFFMTGYRAGRRVRCGRDANGWLLKAHSAANCAHRGLSGRQILLRYYGPRLSIVSGVPLKPAASQGDGGLASAGTFDVPVSVAAGAGAPTTLDVLSLGSAADRLSGGLGGAPTARPAATAGDATRVLVGKVGSNWSFSFTGKGLLLIGQRGPSSGVLLVFVDDRLAAEVNLYADSHRRALLWSGRWANAGSHSVRLMIDGTTMRADAEVDTVLVLN